MPVDTDPLWIVDPICGSTNYLMHDPHFAVGVAYREAGFWQVGVVYEAARDHLYTGTRGGRKRYVRTGCSHRMAHASHRSDADRDG